jgi:hypothetical protein
VVEKRAEVDGGAGFPNPSFLAADRDGSCHEKSPSPFPADKLRAADYRASGCSTWNKMPFPGFIILGGSTWRDRIWWVVPRGTFSPQATSGGCSAEAQRAVLSEPDARAGSRTLSVIPRFSLFDVML